MLDTHATLRIMMQMKEKTTTIKMVKTMMKMMKKEDKMMMITTVFIDMHHTPLNPTP